LHGETLGKEKGMTGTTRYRVPINRLEDVLQLLSHGVSTVSYPVFHGDLEWLECNVEPSTSADIEGLGGEEVTPHLGLR
jgi:hypothetical protein